MNISKQCWPTPWLEAAMRAGFATYRGEDGWEFINDKMRDMLADFAATVQAAERERWIKKSGAVYKTAHSVFNDPPSETTQEVRDVIEWHLFQMRHDELYLDAVLQADLTIRVQTLQAEIERMRKALMLAEAALADIGDGEGPVYDRVSNVNRSWSLYQAEKRALQALPAVRDALAARDDNLI